MRLIVGRGFCRDHVNSAFAFVEGNLPIDQREQGPIPPGTHIRTGNKLGAPLTNDDAARSYKFTTEPFDAQPLASAVASVTDTALTFLVRHITKL